MQFNIVWLTDTVTAQIVFKFLGYFYHLLGFQIKNQWAKLIDNTTFMLPPTENDQNPNIYDMLFTCACTHE